MGTVARRLRDANPAVWGFGLSGVVVALVVTVVLLPSSETSQPVPTGPAAVPCPHGERPWEDTTPQPADTLVGRAAQPYAGPGPHPAVVVSEYRPEERTPFYLWDLQRGFAVDEIPSAWFPAQDGLEVPGLQLVVCGNRVSQGPEFSDQVCLYQNNQKTYRQQFLVSRWSFQVRKAKTGELMDRFELVGRQSICNDWATVFDGRDLPPEVASVDARELVGRLKPYVTAELPG